MKKIEVLGSGCANCQRLEKNAREAVDDGRRRGRGRPRHRLRARSARGVMSTPGLVIDGKVVELRPGPLGGRHRGVAARGLTPGRGSPGVRLGLPARTRGLPGRPGQQQPSPPQQLSGHPTSRASGAAPGSGGAALSGLLAFTIALTMPSTTSWVGLMVMSVRPDGLQPGSGTPRTTARPRCSRRRAAGQPAPRR